MVKNLLSGYFGRNWSNIYFARFNSGLEKNCRHIDYFYFVFCAFSWPFGAMVVVIGLITAIKLNIFGG